MISTLRIETINKTYFGIYKATLALSDNRKNQITMLRNHR